MGGIFERNVWSMEPLIPTSYLKGMCGAWHH